MLYRPFGKLGWPVSAIGLGTWNIGRQWGEVDESTAWATVRSAYESGVNLIDTAESYGVPNGLSEMRLGRALAGIRHNVYLVSKIGHWGQRTGQGVPKTTADMIRLCGHAILGRLRTDWVDVLLCHESDLEDPTVYLQGFQELVDEGVLRAYGISTNSLEVLKRFNREGTCSVLELDYSLLNLEPEKDILPYCQEHGIAVLVRGPLHRGMLSGKYDTSTTFDDQVRSVWNPGQPGRAAFEREAATVDRLRQGLQAGEEMITAALRYVISHPVAPVAIPGAKSPLQAAMNAAAGDRALTPDETAALRALLG
jgi:myo-inositol catabolism protein IolS